MVSPESHKRILFLAPRTKKLRIEIGRQRKARKRARSRLKDMKRYAHAISCRRHFLLTYFGEASPERCGRCDLCMGRHDTVVITPEDEPTLRTILQYIKEEKPQAEWASLLGIPSFKLEAMIRWLLQEAYLSWDEIDEETYILADKAKHFLQDWDPS